MTDTPLPVFTADDFALTDPPECDLIMKGGITSGIVYPYAILELATKYRFRSLGGTSAGAIAAAFAAAAEYARSVRGDPDGFVRLQRRCDALPDRLTSLFQPDPGLDSVTRLVRRAVTSGSWKALARPLILTGLAGAAAAGAALAAIVWVVSQSLLSTILALLLGLMAGFVAALLARTLFGVVGPIRRAIADLPRRMFGFCSGLTVAGSDDPALTDWLHQSLQDIAFGSLDASDILTFGHLERAGARAPIALRMVTTNLSLMRPHTLPDFGMQAGFSESEWRQLFPKAVVDHLIDRGRPWKGLHALPRGADLPVLVATRMSLSFPLLFRAIPLHAEDYEHFRVMRALGGRPERRMRTMWLSDGGISSNFPIHMFDSPLPARPTFAFSLDELAASPDAVARRVVLPSDTMTGLGIPISAIRTLPDFAWKIFYSAKDWQDQLLAGITGQRERIARIYLAPDEGGLNLTMAPGVSRQLMGHGLEAGRLFASGGFSFDEHRWRRLLAFYRNSTRWIDGAGAVWNGGYHDWLKNYGPQASSYRLSARSREKLRVAIDVLLVPPPPEKRLSASIERSRLPKRVGRLRASPEY